MQKVEYSDLYKFLTSFGVVLLFVSIFIQWGILQEVKSINVNDLSALPKDAILFIQSRHDFLMKCGNLLSIFSFLTGLGLTIFGILKWNDRQKIIDKGQDLDLSNKLSRMVSISEKDKIKSHEIEIVSEDDGTDIETIKLDKSFSVKTTAKRYFEVEQEVISCIDSSVESNYKIRKSVKLDNSSFDVVLESGHDGKKHFDIFEIKYYPKRIFYSFLNQGVGRFILSAISFVDSRSRLNTDVSLYMVWIYRDLSEKSKVVEYAVKCQKEVKTNGYQLKIFVAHEDSIKDLKPEIQNSLLWR